MPNLHPAIVHFPIALLFIYSVLKILPFYKWFPNVAWKHVERVFIIFGVLGALAAAVTGLIAKSIVHPDERLVLTHASFAVSTAFVYIILLISELVAIYHPAQFPAINFANSSKVKWLALLGLILVFLTGLLGGVLAKGPSADPLAPILLKLLGISL